MSEAATAPQAAPVPAFPGRGEGGERPQGDKLVDFFLEGHKFSENPASISEAEEAHAGKPAAKAKKPAAEPAPAADVEIDEPEALADDDGDEPEPEKPVLPRDKGTKDKPYSVKDLPEDRFIELKVDGKKQTVAMSELAKGYIRQETFSRVYPAAQEAIKQAQSVVTQAEQKTEGMRARLNQLLETPDDFYDFMEEHAPKTMEQMARKLAANMIEWQKNPQAKYARDAERAQAKIDARQRELDARDERQRAEREGEQRAAQARAAFQPAFQEGLRQLGFPDASKLTDAFKADVHTLVERARRLNGGRITADDVTAAVVQAGRLNPPPAAIDARKPAPAPRAERKPKAGQVDYASRSQRENLGTADFFLRGTKYG